LAAETTAREAEEEEEEEEDEEAAQQATRMAQAAAEEEMEDCPPLAEEEDDEEEEEGCFIPGCTLTMRAGEGPGGHTCGSCGRPFHTMCAYAVWESDNTSRCGDPNRAGCHA
jgi:hypothetical protein